MKHIFPTFIISYSIGKGGEIVLEIKPKTAYVFSVLIALAVGGIAAFLTKGSMETFAALNQPPLSPPGWLFPVVWSILYVLMGISAAMVYNTTHPGTKAALKIYGLQLAVNFLWTIIFFNVGRYFAAFVWLLFLIALLVIMFIRFKKIRPVAAYLQIPYLLWCCFAAYLNFGIYFLNP